MSATMAPRLLLGLAIVSVELWLAIHRERFDPAPGRPAYERAMTI
jgi:hypothetical protein